MGLANLKLPLAWELSLTAAHVTVTAVMTAIAVFKFAPHVWKERESIDIAARLPRALILGVSMFVLRTCNGWADLLIHSMKRSDKGMIYGWMDMLISLFFAYLITGLSIRVVWQSTVDCLKSDAHWRRQLALPMPQPWILKLRPWLGEWQNLCSVCAVSSFTTFGVLFALDQSAGSPTTMLDNLVWVLSVQCSLGVMIVLSGFLGLYGTLYSDDPYGPRADLIPIVTCFSLSTLIKLSMILCLRIGSYLFRLGVHSLDVCTMFVYFYISMQRSMNLSPLSEIRKSMSNHQNQSHHNSGVVNLKLERRSVSGGSMKLKPQDSGESLTVRLGNVLKNEDWFVLFTRHCQSEMNLECVLFVVWYMRAKQTVFHYLKHHQHLEPEWMMKESILDLPDCLIDKNGHHSKQRSQEILHATRSGSQQKLLGTPDHSLIFNNEQESSEDAIRSSPSGFLVHPSSSQSRPSSMLMSRMPMFSLAGGIPNHRSQSHSRKTVDSCSTATTTTSGTRSSSSSSLASVRASTSIAGSGVAGSITKIGDISLTNNNNHHPKSLEVVTTTHDIIDELVNPQNMARNQDRGRFSTLYAAKQAMIERGSKRRKCKSPSLMSPLSESDSSDDSSTRDENENADCDDDDVDDTDEPAMMNPFDKLRALPSLIGVQISDEILSKKASVSIRLADCDLQQTSKDEMSSEFSPPQSETMVDSSDDQDQRAEDKGRDIHHHLRSKSGSGTLATIAKTTFSLSNLLSRNLDGLMSPPIPSPSIKPFTSHLSKTFGIDVLGLVVRIPESVLFVSDYSLGNCKLNSKYSPTTPASSSSSLGSSSSSSGSLGSQRIPIKTLNDAAAELAWLLDEFVSADSARTINVSHQSRKQAIAHRDRLDLMIPGAKDDLLSAIACSMSLSERVKRLRLCFEALDATLREVVRVLTKDCFPRFAAKCAV